MEHVPPSLSDSVGIERIDLFAAFRMMEEDRTLLLVNDVEGSDNLIVCRVEDNKRWLDSTVEERLSEFTLLALFDKARGDIVLSIYAQLCVDLLLRALGDVSLLILDLRNAIKEGIVDLESRDVPEITVSDLQRLYPNGFYNSEARERKMKQYAENIVLSL